MDVYRLSPRSITALRRRLLLATTPLAVAAIVTGLVIAQHAQEFSFGTLAISACISVAAIGHGLFVSLTRSTAAWRSYTLTVSGDGLVRRQAFVPDLTLARSDVTAIITGHDGGLLIRGANSRHVIHVPAGIERRDDLHARLSSWCAIRSRPGLMREPLPAYLATGATLGLMAAATLSNHPAVVVPSALVLMAVLLWAFHELRTRPDVDQRIKSHAKALFFVIAFLGFRAAFVLGLLNP